MLHVRSFTRSNECSFAGCAPYTFEWIIRLNWKHIAKVFTNSLWYLQTFAACYSSGVYEKFAGGENFSYKYSRLFFMHVNDISMRMTCALLIKIPEKVPAASAWKRIQPASWIYVCIYRRDFQHCRDDPVYEPVHLREHNIKLESAMQRGSFIKSFYSIFAMSREGSAVVRRSRIIERGSSNDFSSSMFPHQSH